MLNLMKKAKFDCHNQKCNEDVAHLNQTNVFIEHCNRINNLQLDFDNFIMQKHTLNLLKVIVFMGPRRQYLVKRSILMVSAERLLLLF